METRSYIDKIEAKEGWFDKLTIAVEAVFETLTAKTAEIASAVIEKLTVKELNVEESVTLKSPNGSCFKVNVSDTGEIQSIPAECQ